MRSLVAELRCASDWFADLWAHEPTSLPGRRSKTILHPELGPVPVTCDILLVPEDDQQVVFVTPEPASALAQTLRAQGSAS
ncbi:MAG: MmyB family transcriptional regulator [Nocardioidaceae bacterium]